MRRLFDERIDEKLGGTLEERIDRAERPGGARTG